MNKPIDTSSRKEVMSYTREQELRSMLIERLRGIVSMPRDVLTRTIGMVVLLTDEELLRFITQEGLRIDRDENGRYILAPDFCNRMHKVYQGVR